MLFPQTGRAGSRKNAERFVFAIATVISCGSTESGSVTACTIVGGAGKKSAINERIEEIKMQIEKTTSSYDKEQLQKRLAKLGYYAGHTV